MDPVSYSPVLAALPARERDFLIDRAVKRRLQEDDILHLGGETADRVHLVMSGTLKHTVCGAGPVDTIVGLSIQGDLVGDIGLVDRGAQPFDTFGASDCVLLGIETDLLRGAIMRHPVACLALAGTFAERTRWMAAAANDRSSARVPARLAGRLLDLAEMLGRMNGGAIELDLPLAQTDLGRLAGISRESTCKTLRRFRSAGVLDYKGRRVKILRPDVLRHIKCEGRAVRPSR
ncbi:MAG: Crp/Fnr family transcriptional regulator [Actinomycetota bacterium]